jgi:hypothetical protein
MTDEEKEKKNREAYKQNKIIKKMKKHAKLELEKGKKI